MGAEDVVFLRRAIELAQRSRQHGGAPFGAVLVAAGRVVGESEDRSVAESDPTWHAELGVISTYCRANHVIALDGFSLYCSTEPCVMCASAAKWARISRIVFSVSQPLLQQFTGGTPKPSCDSIVNIGSRKVEVIGPLLLDEGLRVFEGFAHVPTIELHRRMMWDLGASNADAPTSAVGERSLVGEE